MSQTKAKQDKSAARAVAAAPTQVSKPARRMRIPSEAGDILLFKYRAVNKYLLDSLVKSQLHFALPKNLNDPYDCQVDLLAALRRAAKMAKGAQARKLAALATDTTLINTVRNLARKTAVCSFSSSLLNPILWSHYSDEHRGIALLYRIPQAFITDPKTKIVGYSGVEYTNNSLTAWLKTNPVKFDPDYYVSIIKHLLTIKSPSWEYEEEHRILRQRAGRLSIPREYLTQICFGLRTPRADKDLIRKVTAANYSKMDFCEIVAGDSDFGLEARDL
jgi:hypothetical protein